MHKITQRIALAVLLALGSANNTKALTAPEIIASGIGIYTGCYASHLVIRSKSNKVYDLIKAGFLATVSGLCVILTIPSTK